MKANHSFNKYPSPAPLQAVPKGARKTKHLSKRQLFYSRINFDEDTRRHFIAGVGPGFGPLGFVPMGCGPNCVLGIPLFILFYLPLYLVARRNNVRFLRREIEKWKPNNAKAGGLIVKGQLGISAEKAAVRLDAFLLDSTEVIYRAISRFRNYLIVTVLVKPGAESLGYSKVYFFLKPETAESCTIHCRAYKRLLAPCESQHYSRVDKLTRKMIASVLRRMNVSSLQYSWLQTGAGALDAQYPSQPSLDYLAEYNSALEPRIRGSVEELRAQVSVVVFAYTFVGTLALLTISVLLYFLLGGDKQYP
jgi:hypothetical protein